MHLWSKREVSRPAQRVRAAAVAAALVAGLSIAVAPAASAAAPVERAAAASAAATVTVQPSSTVVGYGSSFSVVVSAAGQTSGSVTLKAGSTVVGTKPISAGRATFTVPGTLPLGRQTLTGTYSGGGSAAKAVDIVKVSPVFHIALSKSTVASGTPTKVTVALSAGSAVVTGKVKLLVNGVARSAARLSGGRAVMTLPGLPAGVHTVTGVYVGEAGFTSATSPAVRLTATGPSTTKISITGSTVAYGSSAPITVTVTGPKGAATGRVDVLLSGSVLGAKNLAGGKATWSLPSNRTPKRYTVTARYAGAGVARASVANKAIDVVKAKPTVSVSLSSTNIGVGKSATVSFSISGGGASPTGTYRVLVDGKAVRSGNLSGGRGSASLPSMSAGSHTVTVSYGGDSRYLAVTSAGQRVSVASSSQCPATARACVDLTNSLAWIQSGGKVVYGPVPITSGRPGYRTSAGTFAVYWKDKDHKSSIFNDAPMPNSVFFDGGNAFHEGSLYVPSHGCIHLSWEASEYFYNNLDYGDSVVVFGYAPY